MSQHGSEIPEEGYNKILKFCASGDDFAGRREYTAAIDEYNKAWSLIPEPKDHWHASTWVLAALIDAYFLAGRNDYALDALQYVMTCPDAIGNPFLHLRFGEVLFELGEKDAAANELIRAYAIEGEQIFAAEDPKYFEFLKTKAIINEANTSEEI